MSSDLTDEFRDLTIRLRENGQTEAADVLDELLSLRVVEHARYQRTLTKLEHREEQVRHLLGEERAEPYVQELKRLGEEAEALRGLVIAHHATHRIDEMARAEVGDRCPLCKTFWECEGRLDWWDSL